MRKIKVRLLSRSTSLRKMLRQVFQERVNVGTLVRHRNALSSRRSGHVGMYARKVLEGIELGDQARIGPEEHDLQGISPMGLQLLRKYVAVFGTLFDIVDDDRRTHEVLVEPADDFGIGE